MEGQKLEQALIYIYIYIRTRIHIMQNKKPKFIYLITFTLTEDGGRRRRTMLSMTAKAGLRTAENRGIKEDAGREWR